MNESDKKWIDETDYFGLLYRWRFGGPEDNIFQGESGDYYTKVMSKKRESLTRDAGIRVSKRVGWGRG